MVISRASISHRASPGSRGEKVDSTSFGGTHKVTLQRKCLQEGVTVRDIFASSLHRRLHGVGNLPSLEGCGLGEQKSGL